ncbi:MAG TPA: galactosyldiacylglycerol synthase [Opitutaceae bacterium]|jgi:processive 1,2-diacylglycerol beta-glucosyltransferase|nr:galactosyldiacylglycerol synthase [Opitutaceae bacterium]
MPPPDRPDRVLVLTAGYGEGHNAAARAVAAACDEAAGPGTAQLLDLFALATPRLDTFIRQGYLSLINRAPRLWGRAYRWLDGNKSVPGLLPLGAARRKLAAILEEVRPTVVCSSYPAYSLMLDRLAREGRFSAPHFTIVTDSISINSLWYHAPSTGWFVPNEDSAEVLRRGGVDPARLHVLGFPVNVFFDDQTGRLAPPRLTAGAAPRVLYIIHSGTHHADTTAKLLLAEQDWDITCAVGRDQRLREELSAIGSRRRRPAQVLGWTDRIPELLMTHHVLVSKAGGATTQESIAALCPMIVNQIVPGQEEGNYELLRRHGSGALATTPDAVLSALRGAFANRGETWARWRHALEPIARPGAGRAIAAHLLGRVRIPSA